MQNTEISILVVEGDEHTRCQLVDGLASKYRCISAESASGAIRLSESQFIHLALVDVGLPGMSGLTLTRLIVNRNPLTAVIVLSPESNAQLLTEALNAGASDYITKPFELSNVVQAVERALKRYLPEAVA